MAVYDRAGHEVHDPEFDAGARAIEAGEAARLRDDTKQRAERGWADRDTWNLDTYLAKVIAGSVGHLREISHGYPADLTSDEWDVVLEKIVDGFTAYSKRSSFDPDPPEFTEAQELLARWWGALWD